MSGDRDFIDVPDELEATLGALMLGESHQRHIRVPDTCWRAVGARANADGIKLADAVRGLLAAYAAGLIDNPGDLGNLGPIELRGRTTRD